MKTVVVCGAFDNLRLQQVRFRQEAGKLGTLHVFLWSDAVVAAQTGKPPVFPLTERQYLLQAIRYVQSVGQIDTLSYDPNALSAVANLQADIWAVNQADDTPQKRASCAASGLGYHVVTAEEMSGFPTLGAEQPSVTGHTAPATAAGGYGCQPSAHKTVIVTGCYDWPHSGHVRFFEEVAEPRRAVRGGGQ